MQMQSTYWLEKVLKIISLYVNALLCTLQHIVIHAMQLSGVNSENIGQHQHLRQQYHNSKFVIFQEKSLKVLKCCNFL